MKSKSKTLQKEAAHTIRLGEFRSRRISKFQAKRELAGEERPTIEQAVNTLVDRALDLEAIPA